MNEPGNTRGDDVGRSEQKTEWESVFAKLPGGLMLRGQRPAGLPNVDTPRTMMVRQIGDLASLKAIPEDERSAVGLSVAATLCRARYHRARFDQIVATLNARRDKSGGVVTYDLLAPYTTFEAAGALGAVRLGVDELIYIIARNGGATPKEIFKGWTAESVVRAPFDTRPEFDVPEVNALRARIDWYNEVNEYRNVLYHRGWRDQYTGYFPKGSDLPEALMADRNVMLVPDRGSLQGKTRSQAWTYAEAVRLEDVVQRAVEGFEALVDDVCMGIWGATVPTPGKIPKDEEPNVIVRFVNPLFFVLEPHVLVPLFTSQEKAQQFAAALPPDGERHLVDIGANAFTTSEPAFSLSMVGLREIAPASASGDLMVTVDAPPFGTRLADVKVEARHRVALADVIALGELEPLNVSQAAVGVDRLYVWRGVDIEPA